MRTTPKKADRGNVFKTGLRYFKALNALIEDDDEERDTREMLRKRARGLRLRSRDGKKKGTGKLHV